MGIGYVEDSILHLIRARMYRCGLNPSNLAKKAGLGGSFVYDILKGKSRNPTIKKLNAIMAELGLVLEIKDKLGHPLLEVFFRIKNASEIIRKAINDKDLVESTLKDFLRDGRHFYIMQDGAIVFVDSSDLSLPGVFLIHEGKQAIFKFIGGDGMLLLDEFCQQKMVAGRVSYVLNRY